MSGFAGPIPLSADRLSCDHALRETGTIALRAGSKLGPHEIVALFWVSRVCHDAANGERAL